MHWYGKAEARAGRKMAHVTFCADGMAELAQKVGRGGEAYSFVACLSHLTIDHASLSRRSTVPTHNRDTSNFWALITLFPCIIWRREEGLMRTLLLSNGDIDMIWIWIRVGIFRTIAMTI